MRTVHATGRDQLKQILRLEIKRVIANHARHSELHRRIFQSCQIRQSAGEKDKGAQPDCELGQLVQLGRSGKLDANDPHVIHICDWLFNYAFEQRASDIHLEPRRDAGNVRFRIDGVPPGLSDSDAGAGGDDEPHQDSRPYGRGRKTPSAGWPHQDRDAGQQRVELAPVDDADRVR
jgi:type II secretory ATPase GspE/PulE/Tfp pilus assembly ATPase PilB-like protein